MVTGRDKPRPGVQGMLPKTLHLSQEDYEIIRRLVKQKTGINLGLHKRDLVVSRLAKRLREMNLASFSEYVRFLQDESGDVEMINMINLITTNKTDFFREKHHFDFLAETVLPEIHERGEASGQKVLRCWSAGCSSGEEPYSIAIVISEFFKKKPGWTAKILASDLDTTVLTKARDGIYEASQVEPIPRPLLTRYFDRRPHNGEVFYEVKPALKRMITYRKFNLMAPRYPLKVKLDFIFCRNVLIYFDNNDKRSIVSKFHAVLRPEGFLFIGHSESLMMAKDLYQSVGTTVYRRL